MTQKPLQNQSRKQVVVEQVHVAQTFLQRLCGLIGKENFPTNQTLWFDECNSIHTWFMKFPIDVIFVDRDFKVTKVIQNLKPWRWILPVPKAHSVFEFAAGVVDSEKVKVGDQLHVGH